MTTEPITRFTCPRCDKEHKRMSRELGLFRCECGLSSPMQNADITLGKYHIKFGLDTMRISWLELITSQEVDFDATTDVLVSIYGENWAHSSDALTNIGKHRVMKWVERNHLQQLNLPSLRWKITLEDIEKLMVLR